MIPVVYALFNLVSALAAIPAGRFSDRIGRRRAITYGWAVYALTYLGFALARHAWMIWGLYAFYGLFYALTEDAGKAFPTLFHLWLIGLGVEVIFGDKGEPTDQATVERSHQTITAQALTGQSLADGPAIQAALDDRLKFLAYRYPTRALDGQPPLVAYPEAVHSGRSYRPEWEADLLDMQRVYRYLAQGRWFRQVTPFGQFYLGNHYYGLGVAFANQMIELHLTPRRANLSANRKMPNARLGYSHVA
jgi:hypothetical protein